MTNPKAKRQPIQTASTDFKPYDKANYRADLVGFITAVDSQAYIPTKIKVNNELRDLAHETSQHAGSTYFTALIGRGVFGTGAFPLTTKTSSITRSSPHSLKIKNTRNAVPATGKICPISQDNRSITGKNRGRITCADLRPIACQNCSPICQNCSPIACQNCSSICQNCSPITCQNSCGPITGQNPIKIFQAQGGIGLTIS
ncbi:hypothetical protein PtA15_3A183 [Puccinia triticina]|uniref:Uncharacterized protein n=1 Tax=Puccinia triticina TaxID=208348 RepID=A0ABY7CCP0_9BASI|nr:uncharacterized protein PtA15_3A183 [Puccinia triticina]WAQ82819.1 hypothetical protein PtA15_3A183 [Puccinia triticina]